MRERGFALVRVNVISEIKMLNYTFERVTHYTKKYEHLLNVCYVIHLIN